MFEKIKVLVVDDSAFMRKMISDMINSELDMEVVDTAKDGEIAIDKILKLNPDVVTLDVEMPKKNGLEVLKAVKGRTSAQVIMLSSLTSEGSAITLEALQIGAFDFIQKPSGSISLDINKVKDDLVEKIRYAKSSNKKNKGKIQSATITQSKLKPSNRIDAVVIGASTGGPKVLYEILTVLPGNLEVPIFVVQHMPAGFTKAFAERIDKNSNLRTLEAADNLIIEKNKIYIAPGGYHMIIEGNKVRLDLSPTMHGVRPAVDKLFFSAAEKYRSNLLAVILTGMGRDGADGVREIKRYGGTIIAQDEYTSTVYGMPKSAYETGCVDIVLPDNKVADEITKIVRGNY
ncbi:Chemotaxis response regulator protein-glutamate methylesterase [Caloramator mitchellensis]|uniref:Protein-glutamate methylesterase/protein-glutamine glutaminase n=1 Tax=Caloramator mitchellensis TaxID=908809 RepID=A0A0R3K148_CALMK|nr:chemotaxis response regulator protein-glutamate methylesterase [Caloramator mitchellensis]KRQ85999.1 Chemotaxis response regulator protein-glutamate methylesterase [Caloramator mitchellensis]